MRRSRKLFLNVAGKFVILRWRLLVPNRPSTTDNRRRIAFGELTLMPVWINRHGRAGCVELCHLFRSQAPAGGGKILSELRLVAGTDDHARYGGPLQ